MIKFYSAIVIYNSFLEKSETLVNLKRVKGHDIEIIIFDNSDDATCTKQNLDYSLENGWNYLTDGKNVGLSKAYNRILDFLDEKRGVIIWFDDDTQITQEYFDVLKNSLNDDIDIYAPVIQAQNGKFYSPNEEGFFKNKQLKSLDGYIRQEKFNAINSCTAVKLDLYRDYRYDEELFLDQIDHDFFRSQRLAKKRFFKLPVLIKHNISLKEKSGNSESVKRRFEILIPDYKVYISKRGKLALGLAHFKIIGWGLQQSIKNRDITIAFWVIKNFLKK